MSQLHGGRRTRRNSYIAWGLAFLGFLALELTGYFRRNSAGLRKRIPWYTLSETVWALLRAIPLKSVRALVSVGLVAFLSDLAAHFVFGTSLTPIF